MYMSMKTVPDTLFGLSYPDQPSSGTTVDPTPNNAAIVFKSDQVRIIARKDDSNGINGSIRIIKEGAGEADRATIVIQPDGSIMIDGPKIIIGDGREDAEGDNGSGTQVEIGRGATEPIALGNVLVTKLTDLLTALEQLTVNTGTGPSAFPNNAATFTGIKNSLSDILSKVGKTK